jgi:hypothetical protein
VIEIDAAAIEPQVAFPHLPSNARPISQVGDVRHRPGGHRLVHQRPLERPGGGRPRSCAGAGAPRVRCIIIPGTQAIYLRRCARGWRRCLSRPAPCSARPPAAPVWAATWACWLSRERCVSTTNRNFVGRMGHAKSEVYLAGPAVAAASAVMGKHRRPGGCSRGGGNGPLGSERTLTITVEGNAEAYRAWFQCVRGCEGRYSLFDVIYHCPTCGGLLEVVHDVEALAQRERRGVEAPVRCNASTPTNGPLAAACGARRSGCARGRR